MDWETLLSYMFSSLFTQLNVAKEKNFMAALQKDKPNLVYIYIYIYINIYIYIYI